MSSVVQAPPRTAAKQVVIENLIKQYGTLRALGGVSCVLDERDAVREERISCPILQPSRALRAFLETGDRYVWGVIVGRS